MRIVALSEEVAEDVGALMAREHRHAYELGAPLPSSYLDAAVCSAALIDLVSEGCSGFVATDGSQAVGVMCGKTSGDVGFVPAHGVAVEPGSRDPTRIMVELFAVLAPVLVAQGAKRITIDHVDHDGLATALSDLGLGRGGVFAVRTTEPIDVEPDVQVRVGTAADLDSIATLSHVEYVHRSTPPMYAFQQDRDPTQTRVAHEGLLRDGAIHLLARRAGVDVGLLTIEHTSPAPRLCAAGAPYIGPTATDPDARRSGVGTALLQAALEWARASGHETISVDFDSRNPHSRSFWLGNGFRSTGYRVRRILAMHRTINVDTSHTATKPNTDT